MSTNPSALPPEDTKPDSFTLTLKGLAPHTFKPVGVTIVGVKHRIVIEFDPAAGRASMTCDPPNGLTPCQQLQLVLGLLANVVQVAGANEAQQIAAGVAQNGGGAGVLI